MASGYKFTNIGAGKSLNIQGSNITSLTNHQNVTIWADSGSLEQRWFLNSYVPGYVGSTLIESAVNSHFGLNPYRSGTNWNCDVFPTAGNETDAALTLEPSGSYYKIRLSNYSNRYLTAASSTNGANVYWAAANGSSYQLWSYVFVDDGSGPAPGSNEIPMPQNLNQRYTGNDKVIQDAGCCVCSVCDVASYYHGSNYSLAQMKEYGVYTVSNPNCQWGKAPSVSFSEYSGQSQSAYFSKIRSEISAKRPVIIYMVGNFQHWVVAHGYTGSGASNSEINVLDPYGVNTTSTVGRTSTLAAAMSIQGASTIHHLLLSTAK